MRQEGGSSSIALATSHKRVGAAGGTRNKGNGELGLHGNGEALAATRCGHRLRTLPSTLTLSHWDTHTTWQGRAEARAEPGCAGVCW